MGEHDRLASIRRHQLADSIGRTRVASSSLLDNADLIDTTNVSVVNSLDHSRTDEQYEACISAAVATAQLADVIRVFAHYYRATADNAAAQHGIAPAPS
jgi:hypothetical protein